MERSNAPALPEGLFSLALDFAHTLDGFLGGLHKLSVVLDWDVAALLELEGGVLLVLTVSIFISGYG